MSGSTIINSLFIHSTNPSIHPFHSIPFRFVILVPVKFFNEKKKFFFHWTPSENKPSAKITKFLMTIIYRLYCCATFFFKKSFKYLANVFFHWINDLMSKWNVFYVSAKFTNITTTLSSSSSSLLFSFDNGFLLLLLLFWNTLFGLTLIGSMSHHHHHNRYHHYTGNVLLSSLP